MAENSTIDSDEAVKSSPTAEKLKDIDVDEVISDLEFAVSQNVMMQEREARKKRMGRQMLGSTTEELTEEQERERSRRIRYRFRALMRLMVNYRIAPALDHLYYDKLEIGTDSKSPPVFNVNAFKRVRKYVQLAPQVKRILLKPSEFRTEDEVDLVYKNLSKLAFFERYSHQTQREMARVVMYNFIEEGRIVVRQGHLPLNFYFIISGALQVEVEEKDTLGEVTTRVISELKAGDTFGEVALIHNIPRTASVYSKYPSEVLLLDRYDFNVLLKANVQHEWRGRYNALQNLKHFSSWTPEQIRNCSNNCKMNKYDTDEVIIGNIDGRPGNICFITEGHCKVVEVLRIITRTGTAFTHEFKLQMLSINSSSKEYLANMDAWTTIVRRYIHIMTLEKGQYFGAGEDLRLRYIIAWGKVECIEIPHLYLRRQDLSDWVELLQDNLQMQLPSHVFVFNEFVERASWRAYKHGLFQQTLGHTNKPQMTTLEDVPLSIRQAEETENWITIQT